VSRGYEGQLSDEDRLAEPIERDWRREHTPARSRNPWVVGLAGLCGYEVGAGLVNAALGETVLPSVTSAVARFSWGAVGRRMAPRWAPTVTLVVVAAVGSAMFGRGRLSRSR
jgi:hypothetical protein